MRLPGLVLLLAALAASPAPAASKKAKSSSSSKSSRRYGVLATGPSAAVAGKAALSAASCDADRAETIARRCAREHERRTPGAAPLCSGWAPRAHCPLG